MVRKEDDEETTASFCAGLQVGIIIEGCWSRGLGFEENDRSCSFSIRSVVSI